MNSGIAPSKTHRSQTRALARAVKKAGGQSALARAIGRRQASVWEWLNRPGKVSAEDAVAIEKATGVPAELINGALAEFAALRGLEGRND